MVLGYSTVWLTVGKDAEKKKTNFRNPSLRSSNKSKIMWIFSKYTSNSSEAEARSSTSTTRHLSKKFWKICVNFSFSFISGLPCVAIKYKA